MADTELTPEQIAKFRRKFNMFDLNKDGVITGKELAAVGKVLGYKLSKEEMMSIFGRTDIDESGGITFDEFLQKMKQKMSTKDHKKASIRQLFQQYDMKGKGIVDSDDAHKILKYELGWPEFQTEALIDMFDKNHDYGLSIEEFVNFYSKVEELKDQLHQAWKEFDSDGNGFIDIEEAKIGMRKYGMSDDETERLVKMNSARGDGKLNYDEFKSFWKFKF